MAQEHIIHTRIKNKIDSVHNWSTINPTLLNGEIAIVVEDNGDINIKIGDGTTEFNQLSYIHQHNLSSENISADNITSNQTTTSSLSVNSNVGLSGVYINNNTLADIIQQQINEQVSSAVRYTAQTLTESQAAQARTNISAVNAYRNASGTLVLTY